jgi:hypothetical protein
MRLEEMYHHYSNIEHQKNLPKQLQDKNKLKESEVAIEKFQRSSNPPKGKLLWHTGKSVKTDGDVSA